jgi:hypothetical protein
MVKITIKQFRTYHPDPEPEVFVLTHKCCVLSAETTNTNCIVFGFTRSGLETTIYRTRDEHAMHYITDSSRNQDTVAEYDDMSIR